MTDNEAPSIGERYGVAIGTGLQRDVVLAAGMQRNALGAMLLRLAAEYDMVRGDLERAGEIAPRHEVERAELVARVKALRARVKVSEDYLLNLDMTAQADRLTKQAEALPKRTEHEVKSARAFILLGLKTLAETKQTVGALALTMGKKRGVAAEVAFKLAGRVLDVYLDPMCHVCDGTGLIGSLYSGGAEKQCDACNGTGSRRDILGNALAETMLARDLFAELQRRAAQAAAGMRAAMTSDAGPVVTSETQAALDHWLAHLRSPEAVAD